MVNTGTVNIKYKPVGSGTWLVLTPGAPADLTGEFDILNENFSTGQLTAQRNISATYNTAYVARPDPGSQGRISPGGVVCNTGRFVVTTYAYFNQFVGNLYGRAYLTPLAGPAMSPSAGHGAGVTNPVVTAWGYESYSGTQSRLEMTTLNPSQTGGIVSLVGSTDPTCSTMAYAIEQQGDYINWNNTGVVTTRSMACSNNVSFPVLSPVYAVSLLLALGGLAVAAARRVGSARAR